MQKRPKISIVIPHRNGREILFRCLEALSSSRFRDFEIILVNNASTDGSVVAAVEAFDNLRVIEARRNLGYAGGCNLGMLFSRGEFLLLLNNDAVMAPEALGRLVEAAERWPRAAALQPKILSLSNPKVFDYAGAAGGMMDLLGYPFARGRLFDTLERDEGQYDTPAPIFWASGACCLLRRTALEETGLLDEDFFAHMEEIDLNWRMQLLGWEVRYVPDAVVYHDAGTTLAAVSPRKTYLNHRNGLLMLAKNFSPVTLLWLLPLRIVLDLAAAAQALGQGRGSHAVAVLRALVDFLCMLPGLLPKRRAVQRTRRLDDRQLRERMYRGSIVTDYFIRGIKTYGDLPGGGGHK